MRVIGVNKAQEKRLIVEVKVNLFFDNFSIPLGQRKILIQFDTIMCFKRNLCTKNCKNLPAGRHSPNQKPQDPVDTIRKPHRRNGNMLQDLRTNNHLIWTRHPHQTIVKLVK